MRNYLFRSWNNSCNEITRISVAKDSLLLNHVCRVADGDCIKFSIYICCADNSKHLLLHPKGIRVRFPFSSRDQTCSSIFSEVVQGLLVFALLIGPVGL